MIKFLVFLVALSLPTQGQFGRLLQKDSKTSSGLKEALQIGLNQAVQLTAVTDGYFKNEAIKILMPEKIRKTEKGLRLVGLGPKIDEFELSMNRAAEAAAPEAKAIFGKALRGMSFTDATKILAGGETAATDFFKSRTTEQLTAAFKPKIEATMATTGVVALYKPLSGGLQSLVPGQSFDITDYVVGKSLDGLFYMLGQEEKKIRTNPAARITPLLRDVFGKAR